MKKLIPLVLCVMLACLAIVPAFAEVEIHGASFDTVIINGDEAPAAVNFGLGDGAASNKLDQLEPARLVDGSDGDISTITLRGWLGFESNDIAQFGYRIGTTDTFDDSFFEQRLDIGAIQKDGNGGPRAQAFKIAIDVSGVKGQQAIVALAKLDNGTVVAIDASVPKHGEGTTPNTSFTYVGLPTAGESAEPRDYEKADGKDTGLSYDEIDIDGVCLVNAGTDGYDKLNASKKAIDGTKGDIQTIGLKGWYGASEVIEFYGYGIDNQDIVFSPEFIAETDDAVLGAGGQFARRFLINIDVSGLEGDGHVIWAYAKLATGEVIKLNRCDNRGQDNEKDREIYIIYNGPAAQGGQQGQQPGGNPGTADASMVIFVVAAAAIALIILKKKVF